MFTIFNIINYFTGRYIPIYILILLTIGVYYYIIKTWFLELLLGNITYLIIFLLLLLIDITTIIIIFTSGYFMNSDSNLNLDSEINFKINKESNTIKKKINKEKKQSKKKNKKNKLISINDNINNNINHMEIKSQENKYNVKTFDELISLYDNDKNGSINTYHLMK